MKNIIRFAFIINALILICLFFACEKSYEKKKITYQITRSISGFNVVYKNESNELIKDTIETNSADDIWSYNFDALPRDIVYVSASYKDTNSAVLVRILIDGKIYKQASTTKDTLSYVTVSGTVNE